MGSDNPDIQLACFSLGEDLFGVDIMRVREIILPQKLLAQALENETNDLVLTRLQSLLKGLA